MATPHPICIEFVAMVEEIIKKRIKDQAARPHSRYEEEEITRPGLIDIYPGYHGLYYGNILNPPKRAVIMEIAEYLRATSEELRRLLVAAGLVPLIPQHSGDSLRAALDIGDKVMRYWRLPSFLITRDWRIWRWNKEIYTLFDLQPEDLDVIPEQERHILNLIFDPKWKIRQRLSGNSDTWAYTARLNIYAFKQTNLLCKNDEWYKARINSLSVSSDFANMWKEIEIDREIIIDPIGNHPFPTYSTEITTRGGQTVWVLGLQTSLGNFDYPMIISYIPYRDEDRKVFNEIGLPTPDNNWGSK